MFNGYYVTYFCNDSKTTKTARYETKMSVLAATVTPTLVSAEEFANGCFNVFGDIVRDVQDKDGNVLYDNTKQYEQEVEEFNNFY